MKILLTADWHVRGEAPACRKFPDQWIKDQQDSIENVARIAATENADEVWVLGDAFHQARVSTESLNMLLTALEKFTMPVRFMCGNHDLLYHAYENLNKSSIGILLKKYPQLENSTCTQVAAWPFGCEPEDVDAAVKEKGASIWATHQLTFMDDKDRPYPGVGVLAQDLLDQCPSAKIVVTGDYHHGYIYDAADGRSVITPGCLNIQVCDMKDYEPRAYLLDLDTLKIKECPLEKFGEVDDSYKVREHEVADGLESFVESMEKFNVESFDFEEALRKSSVTLDADVQGIVVEILDEYHGDRK